MSEHCSVSVGLKCWFMMLWICFTAAAVVQIWRLRCCVGCVGRLSVSSPAWLRLHPFAESSSATSIFCCIGISVIAQFLSWYKVGAFLWASGAARANVVRCILERDSLVILQQRNCSRWSIVTFSAFSYQETPQHEGWRAVSRPHLS